MKSKYVKADINNSFLYCSKDLQDGKKVLYIGLPCEIFALKNFLKIKKVSDKNLILIDLICHGVPSIEIWNKYIEEKFPLQRIIDVDFRYKKIGWEKYFIKVKTNKVKYVSFKGNDEYMRAFLKCYSLLPSCYNCLHKANNHLSHLTIGDFWDVQKYSPNSYCKKGTSLVVIHNKEKVDKLLAYLNVKGVLREEDIAVLKFCNPSYFSSSVKPEDIDKYKKILETDGFLKAVNCVTKSENYSQLIRLKNKFKSLY